MRRPLVQELLTCLFCHLSSTISSLLCKYSLFCKYCLCFVLFNQLCSIVQKPVNAPPSCATAPNLPPTCNNPTFVQILPLFCFVLPDARLTCSRQLMRPLVQLLLTCLQPALQYLHFCANIAPVLFCLTSYFIAKNSYLSSAICSLLCKYCPCFVLFLQILPVLFCSTSYEALCNSFISL